MHTGTKSPIARKRRGKRSPNRVPQEAHGLWIDRDLLRRHMNPLPNFVRTAEPADQHDVSRYLELADTLLQAADRENTS